MSLFASINASATSLSAFERALEVTQENVVNASTAGYARQDVRFDALPFRPFENLMGGVEAAALLSSRSDFAEEDVRHAVSILGYWEARAQAIAGSEAALDATGEAGIPAALTRLIESFSAWSAAPASLPAREAVRDGADRLAQAFRTAAAILDTEADRTEAAIRSRVADVNRLATQVRDYNIERLRSGCEDAGASARVYASIEELAGLADVRVLKQADGTFTLLLGGQSPLVIGETAYLIRSESSAAETPSYSPGRPPVRILAADGRDISPLLIGGQLAALLSVHNEYLPSLIGDASQPGALNTLAKAFADRVNTVFEGGWISAGPPPVPGIALFAYDSSNDANVARTLTLNSAATADRLAAIDPGPPYSANGVTRTLASLADGTVAANQLDGLGFMEHYGALAARAGREIAQAREDASNQRQVAIQARYLRDQISGVSLNEEAVMLMEFQRAYEAASRMIRVLDELVETALTLVR